ncbi:MAG: hypothetical protein ABII85_02225 [Bacillota bacterium]
MYKLSFNYLKDVDEFNEKLIIYIDGEKMESEPLMIEPGLHEVKVEQYHILNSGYFLFGALLMAMGFFGYATESAYLLRRWGRFAICKLTINVQKDEQVIIRLHRHKKWFLSDGYQLSVKYEQVENANSTEKRNLFTVLGTFVFALIPFLVFAGIIWLFN